MKEDSQDWTVPVTVPGHDPEPEREPERPLDITDPDWQDAIEQLGLEKVMGFIRVNNLKFHRQGSETTSSPCDAGKEGPPSGSKAERS